MNIRTYLTAGKKEFLFHGVQFTAEIFSKSVNIYMQSRLVRVQTVAVGPKKD